jgi:hypothetical protein
MELTKMALNKEKIKDLCERYENVAKFLRSYIGEGGKAAGADNEEGLNEEDLLPRSYGLDSKGRRLVRPPTAQARKSFEEEQGIAGRRIRVLG